MGSTFGKTSLSSLYESLYIFGKQQKFARSFINHQELEEAPEGDAKTPLSSALQNQKAKGRGLRGCFYFFRKRCYVVGRYFENVMTHMTFKTSATGPTVKWKL